MRGARDPGRGWEGGGGRGDDGGKPKSLLKLDCAVHRGAMQASWGGKPAGGGGVNFHLGRVGEQPCHRYMTSTAAEDCRLSGWT